LVEGYSFFTFGTQATQFFGIIENDAGNDSYKIQVAQFNCRISQIYPHPQLLLNE
jgi:hypothetical protein